MSIFPESALVLFSNEEDKMIPLSQQNVSSRLLRARLHMRDALAPGIDGGWSPGREYEKVRPW